MKEIQMYRGQIAQVDDVDFERLKDFRWTLSSNGYVRRTGDNGTKGSVYMHREILGTSWPGYEIDHIDRNKLNNQKSNLRFVTRAQNMQNREGGSSQFLGVTWHTRDAMWQAAINKDGHTYYLGQYNDETKAAKAYDKKAFELYGLDATLNFARPPILPTSFPFENILSKQ